MARPRPHVRVHLTTRTHRRTAELWADPEMRGMAIGLWQVAAEGFAARTANKIHLDRTSIMWITGRTQYAHALRALRALCARLEYAVSAHGALVVVEVRNFQQKQGFGSGNAPLRTPNSELRTPNTDSGGSRSAISRSRKQIKNGHELPEHVGPSQTRDHGLGKVTF